MSRTEGVTLPRLPTTHIRVTSPGSIQPVTGTLQKSNRHIRALSGPDCTAYIGIPRQDVPHNVYQDAAMFDDVFDKQGKLFVGRTTPKITSPLHTLGYNSLHDPHCRKLYLNNRKLRGHLINLGLITDDLRVVSSTKEQRQKIRAHELLERKEQLIQTIEAREINRLKKLQQQQQQQVDLPKQYSDSLLHQEERRRRMESIQRTKMEKLVKAEEEQRERERRRREEDKARVKKVLEEKRLLEQARRNAARAQQELAEMAAYETHYGKFGHHLAKWHRDADKIHNRMVIMEHKHWSKARKKDWLSESYPPPSHQSSESSVADVQNVTATTLQLLAQKQTADSPEHKEEKEMQPGESEQKPEQPKATKEEPLTTREAGDEHGATFEREDPVKQSSVVPETGTPRQEVKGHPSEVTEVKREPEEIRFEREVSAGPSAEGVSTLSSRMQEETVVVLDAEQSALEFTKILIEGFTKLDHSQTGLLSTDDFVQVLNSRDLGLQLNESELLHIAGQMDVYGNGWIPYIHVTPILPTMLITVYTQRAEQAIQQYGVYLEEQWCQLSLSGAEVIYLNKLTGVIQYTRPDDFRPSLRDDVFEDSIVDFFETADTNRDGIIDYTDFYNLMVSPMVSTRIYSNQMEELLQLCQAYAVGGSMGLEEFIPISRALLLMIYQNAYPGVEEWIELESRKCGTFWFNNISGEIYLPELGPTETVQQPLEQVVEEEERAVQGVHVAEIKPLRRKKKSHKLKKKTVAIEDQPPRQGPPPLRKRSSHSRGNAQEPQSGIDISPTTASQVTEPNQRQDEPQPQDGRDKSNAVTEPNQRPDDPEPQDDRDRSNAVTEPNQRPDEPEPQDDRDRSNAVTEPNQRPDDPQPQDDRDNHKGSRDVAPPVHDGTKSSGEDNVKHLRNQQVVVTAEIHSEMQTGAQVRNPEEGSEIVTDLAITKD